MYMLQVLDFACIYYLYYSLFSILLISIFVLFSFFCKLFFCMNHLKNLYWIFYNIASVLCFGFQLWSMWDFSSLTRDRTHTPCTGMLTTGPPEKSLALSFNSSFFSNFLWYKLWSLFWNISVYSLSTVLVAFHKFWLCFIYTILTNWIRMKERQRSIFN